MTVGEIKRFIDENQLDDDCQITVDCGTINDRIKPVEEIVIQDEEFGEVRLITL